MVSGVALLRDAVQSDLRIAKGVSLKDDSTQSI
jgi:hypothetical protein